MIKKRRAYAIISFLLSALLFCGCAFLVVRANRFNREIRSGFEQKQSPAADVYANKAELAAVSPQVYNGYLVRDTAIVASTQQESYRLHKTLRYYAHPGDLMPVQVQEAGTEVQVYPMRVTGPNAQGEIYVHFEMPASAYGFWYSLPTTERGWRCTRMLQTGITAVDREDQSAAEEALPLYYVRTEDLQAEAKVFFDQSLPGFVKNDVRTDKWITFSGQVVYGLDYAFFRSGVVVSPDLLAAEWTVWNTILCVLGAAGLIAGILLLPKGKNQREPYRRELADGPFPEESK